MLSSKIAGNSDGIKIVSNPKKADANFVSASTIKFDDCFVPKERLISDEGLKGALSTITYSRVFVSARAAKKTTYRDVIRAPNALTGRGRMIIAANPAHKRVRLRVAIAPRGRMQ